ncbi:MAG: hypothetical protein DSZ28_09425 [Thiothrix sp.]|nr:MAG: hypothetical protein DSZ28_09425 [Thiothrix sp.]
MDIKKRKNKKLLHDPHGWFHRLFLNEALLSVLLILCFIGVAYTNVASVRSYHYWLWMIPVFAFSAIISEWSHYKRHEISGYRFIRQQILHWIAVFLAIKSIFLLNQIGRFNNDVTALSLMITLSLSTFIAGVYIGWRFIVLGLFISLATLLIAYMEVYIWVLIPVAIGIVIVGIVVAWWEFRKS